ncbi:MAG TPA: HAMP domain-containing sensor histidine kinase [Ignavibacteriaceae bacterium]|nr:HAMP domain-containing sensor histidine kinase [Ignavibacteriaceae bacterium]
MKTIKTRFIFFTIVLIIISLGFPIFFLISQFRINFNQRSGIMLKTTLDLLNYTLENTMIEGDQKNLQGVIDSLVNQKGIDHIRIIDTKGIIKYSGLKKEIGNNVKEINYKFNIDSLTSLKMSQFKDNKYLAFSPIMNKPSCIECHTGKVIAYLDVGTNLTPAETKFYTGTNHMIFLGIAILLIISAGFWFIFQTFISKPLQKLINAMQEVKKGNLSSSLKIERNDEFGIVNKNFNLMVDRLRDSQEEINKLHFEQLQHVDRLITLGELTSETAHEINNHSAIIMSRADYLSFEALQTPEISKYSDDINVILNQITKVSEITRNVLKHSKKVEKNFERIDLVNVIENTLNSLHPILIKRNVELIKYILPQQAFIKGDALQIEQALTNLIINSIDSMNGEGRLKISLIDADSLLTITITDNGSGINDSIKEQIFLPFFTTKKGGKGSGLGLYIVKNICKNHNAELEMESKAGEGTTFKIIFNVKRVKHEETINN